MDDRKAIAANLRKLASAIRTKVDQNANYKTKTAAHVLRAAKGLTLLRDRVR